MNSQTKPIFTEFKLFEGDFCPRLSPDLLELWETQTQQTDDESSSVSGIDSADTLLESSDDTQGASDGEDVIQCSDQNMSPASVVDHENNVNQERPVLHKNSVALSKNDEVQNKCRSNDNILPADEDNSDQDNNASKKSENHQRNDNLWDKVAAIQRPKKSATVRKQNTKGKIQRIVMNRVVVEASLPLSSDESFQESIKIDNNEATNFLLSKKSTKAEIITDDLDDDIISLNDSPDTDDEHFEPIPKSQKNKTKGKKNTNKIGNNKNQNQRNTEVENILESDDGNKVGKNLGTKKKVGRKPKNRGKNV